MKEKEERIPSCNWSSTRKVSKFIFFRNFAPSLTCTHTHTHTLTKGEGRQPAMLGGVSRDSLFRGKLSTFNFQLSFPSVRVLCKYRTAWGIQRRWKKTVRFDGSSASILNAELSVGQLRCATCADAQAIPTVLPHFTLIGRWKMRCRHIPYFPRRRRYRHNLVRGRRKCRNFVNSFTV
jgi:hypothetical protein